MLPLFKNFITPPLLENNLVGYLRASGVNFDNPDLASSLLVASLYNGAGYFPSRKDNFLEKLQCLPLVATLLIIDTGHSVLIS